MDDVTLVILSDFRQDIAQRRGITLQYGTTCLVLVLGGIIFAAVMA